MAKGIRYSDEFKQEAENRVAIHGFSVAMWLSVMASVQRVFMTE